MLLSVTGFESTKTVQIRIYNVTTTTEVVAWTSTGVTERADGQGYSVYYYSYTLTAGSEYIVDWKDNSTPVKTASEGINGLDIAAIVADTVSVSEVVIVNSALAELGESQVTALADKSTIGLQTLYNDARNELLGLFPWAFALKRTRLKAAGLLNCSAKTISFAVNITDSGSGFVTGGFVAKERVRITGSGNNNTDYRLNTVSAGVLTVETYEVVKAEVLVNSIDLKLYAMPNSWDYKYVKPSDSVTIRSVNDYGVGNMRIRTWDVENDYIVTNEMDEYDEIDVEYIQKVTDTTKFSDLFTQVLILKLAAKLCMAITQSPVLKESLEARAKAKMLDNMAASEGSRNEKREDSSWQDR